MQPKIITTMFQLPSLPYGYDALEPNIDARTMEIHHSKHHNAYTTNLNNELAKLNLPSTPSIEDICKNISTYSPAIRNNGGGFYNHSLFWKLLTPNASTTPTGNLAKAITDKFGSFDAFKDEFSKAATTRFGSGWAWLVVHDGMLVVTSTPNQDNPLMDIADVKGNPILALDVWEHAYYLNYQNRRPDYINAFFNVINWQYAEELYNAAR